MYHTRNEHTPAYHIIIYLTHLQNMTGHHIHYTLYHIKGYSEHCQTSKMELFAKTLNHFQLISIFGNSSILRSCLAKTFNSIRTLMSHPSGCASILFVFKSSHVCTVGYNMNIRLDNFPRISVYCGMNVFLITRH